MHGETAHIGAAPLVVKCKAVEKQRLAPGVSAVRQEEACVPAGRLNWQLHFGEAPKWSSGVKFILVDVEPSQRDADKAALVLRGDAAAVAQQLSSALRGIDTGRSARWRQQLSQKVSHTLLCALAA